MRTHYWIMLILFFSIISAQIAIWETKNRLVDLTPACEYAELACNQSAEICLSAQAEQDQCRAMNEAVNNVLKECD